MKIAGLVKCSFVDYPGLLAAVVFMSGCNLRCVFCHNKGLVDADATSDWAQQEVLAWLKTRRGLLDAVVVSGGEPTLQPDILEFLARIHMMGFRTKLDTNGMRPDVLRSVIDAGFIDYVAMDIKGPFEKYAGICGATVDLDAVNDSISMLLKSHIDHEFRTTVIPGLTRADILAVGGIIHGANIWFRAKTKSFPLANDLPDHSGGLNTSFWHA